MPIQAMRHAIARHRASLARGVASATLFATAAVTVVEKTTHPTAFAARPAVLAVTTPVHASPRPHVIQAAVQRPTPPKKPAPPDWDLANIAHPRVDKWVSRFTSSLDRDFGAALRRGTAYDDMISTKLAARGMPQELYYLAMIESEFKPAAKSRVSAVGLWQFMAGTARHYGLTVSRHTDERTNPARATDAALTYLGQLHNRFGSWYLAAAAYNAGPGTVSRALRRVTGRTAGTDTDFYRIDHALPSETREYVPKLIAAARVGKASGHF